MLADQYLEKWIMTHIGAGTPLADAGALANQLIRDAQHEGFTEDILEMEAGILLPDYIEKAIRQAVEEDLR